MGSRVITIHGATPYMDAGGKFVEVPVIRLQGKWVERLGFRIGDRIEVHGDGDGIAITLTRKGQQKGFQP